MLTMAVERLYRTDWEVLWVFRRGTVWMKRKRVVGNVAMGEIF